MPRNPKSPVRGGVKRPALKHDRPARSAAPLKRPAHLRTQISGGRPPRIPGRIGGR